MNKALIVPVSAIFALTLAVSSHAKVDYHLNKVENPSADELDAYERISAAMDSAVYMYNKYTHMTKHIEVHYNTGVQTADASYNGTMRFGAGRAYMNVRTAMHEMGHTMGMGTTSEYRDMLKDGVFQGPIAQAKLKELTGDPEAVLKGDSQHFWPYGLNYDSELHSEEDLIIHCQIVEAMYQDIFKEKVYMEKAKLVSAQTRTCMGMASDNSLKMMDCGDDESTVRIVAVGDNADQYRIEFGDRVLDVPNESTAAGVTLGTYYWNAGSHQKYALIEADDNNSGTIYLQNQKSKLYVGVSGENLVQDELSKGDPNTYNWIILDKSNEQDNVSDPDTSGVQDSTDVGEDPSAIARRALIQKLNEFPRLRFDTKGRAIRPGRRQSKFLKLF